jgi:hypothetical protein
MIHTYARHAKRKDITVYVRTRVEKSTSFSCGYPTDVITLVSTGIQHFSYLGTDFGDARYKLKRCSQVFK